MKLLSILTEFEKKKKPPKTLDMHFKKKEKEKKSNKCELNSDSRLEFWFIVFFH